MTALSPFIHFALTLSDALDATTDELPEPLCQDQRLMLAALARALQLAAEKLKLEELERERKLVDA